MKMDSSGAAPHDFALFQMSFFDGPHFLESFHYSQTRGKFQIISITAAAAAPVRYVRQSGRAVLGGLAKLAR